MAVKLFIFGCSGSGKSTAAHHIAILVGDRGCSAIRINDYEILFKMFKADAEDEDKRFRSVEYGGFDVLDLTVYDTALREVEEEVKRSCSEGFELIIIEFARDDYSKALKLFNNDFLQDAYFIFLGSEPDICIQRIHKRAAHPTTPDDHFVPDHIVTTYHHQENKRYISSHLKIDYGIDDSRIVVIDNMGQFEEIKEKINRFIEHILQRGVAISEAD